MSAEEGEFEEDHAAEPMEPAGTEPEDLDERPSARPRALFPPWPTRLFVVVCLALIVVVRTCVPVLERALINIFTLVLLLVAAITLLAWFVLRSGFAKRRRYEVAAAIVAVVIVLVAALRVEHVTGDLVPRFKFRWQAHADQLLQEPVVQAGAVDLAKTSPYDFPQFLGPDRNASVSKVTLERDWKTKPPKQLWRIPIGAGWSGFAAVNGFAVTLEQRGPDELVTCYELATGQLKWAHVNRARHATIPGGIGPRSTPTIQQGRVYALGATGMLWCLDGATGREVWKDDLLQRIGITADVDSLGIAWGRSASPLVVDDLVVVPLGGKSGGPWVSLAAYHKGTGQLAWTAGKYQASYSSPCVATIHGVRQILIVNQDFVTGHQPETGAVLWEYPWPGLSNTNASVSQPVALPNDCLLLSKGYGGGGRLLQFSLADKAWRWREIWTDAGVLKTKFTNVVVRDDYVYGLSDGILECIQWSTGKRKWKAGRYGPGQVLGVGDVLLVQTEDGPVVMVEATPEQFRELGRFPALSGKTWNTLCLVDHRLLVRNSEEAACYELP